MIVIGSCQKKKSSEIRTIKDRITGTWYEIYRHRRVDAIAIAVSQTICREQFNAADCPDMTQPFINTPTDGIAIRARGVQNLYRRRR